LMAYLLDSNICVFFLRGKLQLDEIIKEKVRLKKIGRPMHDEFDLITGVTAVTNKLTLVTDNTKHFFNIKGIVLENWAIPR
jgi:predicted nucleic acid-binding protein